MSEDAAVRDALEQRYAERLLEDERLRADLTDDEFQPLQDWALDRLHERATALAEPAAPEAETELERMVAGLRAALQAANDAIGHRLDLDGEAFADQLGAISAALEPALYGAEGAANQARLALQAVIPTLVTRKDEAEGRELSDALVAALAGAAGATTDAGRDGASEPDPDAGLGSDTASGAEDHPQEENP